MKHETFYSIIAALGLVIALFVAAHQFWPQADQLDVVSEGIVDIGRPITIQRKAFMDPSSGTPEALVGSVTWKVRIHNSMDRTVSIVSYKLFGLSGDNLYYSSSFGEKLSSVTFPNEIQILPDNIGPRETKAYLLSTFMPIQDTEMLDKCISHNRNLSEFGKCYFKAGMDMFGNPVTPYLDEDGNVFGARWENGGEVPNFLLDIETADGSKFSTTFAYWPF